MMTLYLFSAWMLHNVPFCLEVHSTEDKQIHAYMIKFIAVYESKLAIYVHITRWKQEKLDLSCILTNIKVSKGLDGVCEAANTASSF